MDKIKPLFTATAVATNGRNGHTGSHDGTIKADLSVPRAAVGLGKPGYRNAGASLRGGLSPKFVFRISGVEHWTVMRASA
jgi:hypothetical protein